MIAPLNLFFLFTVSRMLIIFTISSVVLKSTYSFDILISIAASFVIVMLISIPVIKLIENNKNVLNNKIIAFAYGVYFIYAGAINVSKFAMFSSTELNQNAKLFFLAATMIVACIYAASLRIEAISRFGSFVFVFMALGVIGLTGFCAKDFSSLNLFPLVRNNSMEIFKNTLFSVASTNELLLIFALAPKVKGKIKKYPISVTDFLRLLLNTYRIVIQILKESGTEFLNLISISDYGDEASVLRLVLVEVLFYYRIDNTINNLSRENCSRIAVTVLIHH